MIIETEEREDRDSKERIVHKANLSREQLRMREASRARDLRTREANAEIKIILTTIAAVTTETEVNASKDKAVVNRAKEYKAKTIDNKMSADKVRDLRASVLKTRASLSKDQTSHKAKISLCKGNKKKKQ